MKKITVFFTKEEVKFIRELFSWSRKVNLVLFQATLASTGISLFFNPNYKILYFSIPLALFFILQYRSYIVKATAFNDNLGKEKKGKFSYELSSLMKNFILQEFRLSFIHKKPIGKWDRVVFNSIENKIREKLPEIQSKNIKEAVK